MDQPPRRNLLAALTPDARWTEAEGFPYAGTYVGAEAIITGVFRRLATEWIGYRADVHTYLEDGDRIAAFGVYSGTYKAMGKVDARRLPISTRSVMERSPV
ncbi:nuclear transport factor 2 family protein [Mesorhizobium sp. L2C066B000]|uniref:nuclear transport factor 2 family protein n=1 Tax=Mesorhizobium sp. L2C066B000 TaxID=1287105 RepID=UPI001FD93095|nr:nuclear transport factor 2 family protein [Mesorhizobium sp. L2C066B000]